MSCVNSCLQFQNSMVELQGSCGYKGAKIVQIGKMWAVEFNKQSYDSLVLQYQMKASGSGSSGTNYQVTACVMLYKIRIFRYNPTLILTYLTNLFFILQTVMDLITQIGEI